jgi:hypothetical protein
VRMSDIQELAGFSRCVEFTCIFDCTDLVVHVPGHIPPNLQPILWFFTIATQSRRRFTRVWKTSLPASSVAR